MPAGADTIERYALVGGRIVVSYLHDVTSRLAVFGLDGAPLGEIALPGIGTVGALNGRWKSDEFYIGFSSFTTPRITLKASVAKRAAAPLWRANVPFAGDDFEVKQVWFASKDGTRVPMFVFQKKGTPEGVARPTLLYGYGGFDVSEKPRFSSFAAWFVEQGGTYALANIRGGSEFGEAWHRAGMLGKKQNVFDDFIAAAEWLVANKITSPDRLAIQGGSNGGLLVGAALTQRPDLFRAVLCEYPDLDMLGYHRFKNNNPPALLEYGDASKPEEFKFLSAYSPYQKVTPGTRYPAVFLRTGDQDTVRVYYHGKPVAARNPPFSNLPKRIFGPCRSSRIPTGTCVDFETSRMFWMRAACISCVPWDMFKRKTPTPARSSCSTRCGVSLAGPRVATILVFGIGERGSPGHGEMTS